MRTFKSLFSEEFALQISTGEVVEFNEENFSLYIGETENPIIRERIEKIFQKLDATVKFDNKDQSKDPNFHFEFVDKSGQVKVTNMTLTEGFVGINIKFFPTTTKQRFANMLMKLGMSDNQAKSVLDEAIPIIEKNCERHAIAWDNPETQYINAFYFTMWLELRKLALNWINNNVPEASFRKEFIG
jgi:hypothetical protein